MTCVISDKYFCTLSIPYEFLSFSILENSTEGTMVGQVIATDVDQNITNYQISGSNVFNIDNAGKITVKSQVLNYEDKPKHRFFVNVIDQEGLSHKEKVTVYLEDIKEEISTFKEKFPSIKMQSPVFRSVIVP